MHQRDISSYGATVFSTPTLDLLANKGVRVTNFYAAQPVCSASRAALLEGCYPNRIGIEYALGPESMIQYILLSRVCMLFENPLSFIYI